MIPNQYKWILQEGGPKMIVEALKEFGVAEKPGPGNNPKILAWAAELGLSKTYSNDGIPWCGLFVGVIAKRAGKEVVKDPLWALNWGNFGVRVSQPMLGDVLVFIRNGGGHVGLYVGEDETAYHVLGGNQADQVCFTRIAKSRLYQARRPIYTQQPSNVRKVTLSASGGLSTNEA